MRVAAGQFAVTPVWRTNAQTCVAMMQQAEREGRRCWCCRRRCWRGMTTTRICQLNRPSRWMAHFCSRCWPSRRNSLTTVLTLHVPSGEGRATNTLVVLREGAVIAHYHKLHLYDAFAMQESRRVDPGQQIPPVIEVAGLRVGLMTCYDLRFPELALSLALNGAQLLVLPAAWVKGPQKEHHWATLLAARALDTTCYIVAAGECGTRNIGLSRIVDPLGTTLAGAGSEPQLIFADLSADDLARVRERLPVLRNRRFAPPQLL